MTGEGEAPEGESGQHGSGFVNVAGRAASVGPVRLHEDLHAALDDRTLKLLERRRGTSTVKRRGWLVRRALLAADVVGLLVAFTLVEWIAMNHTRHGTIDAQAEMLVFVASIPVWIVVAKLYGLYDHDEERTDHSTADDFAGVFHMVTVCTWLLWAFAYLTGFVHPHASRLVPFWASAVGFVVLARALARAVVRRSEAYLQNTVIVGAGEVGQLVAKKLLQHPEYGINLVGFVDAQPRERRDDLEHLVVLGGPDRLPEIVRLLDVERVIVAFSGDSHEETLELIRGLRALDVQVDVVPRLFELVGPGVGMHTVEGIPLVGLPPPRLSHSSRLLKRTIDLALALGGLVVLSPLFAAVAVAIKLDSRGPVLFRQVRMGARGRTFRILKFRTMVADADARKQEFAHLNKHLLPGGDARMFKINDDPRVTRVGKLIRRYSVDELPQLLNVLSGQMSLVGPRPLILDEDRHVESWGRRRLELKPGITGIWQVNGRDGIPFGEMVRLDYLYVMGWSPWSDMALIFRTLPAIARSAARAR